MKEQEIREMVRKQIIGMINEAPNDSFLGRVGSSVRARLGGRRQQLNKLLADIDTVRLARLPKGQKIELIVALMQQFGITSRDFGAIKARVQKDLSAATDATQDMPTESIDEARPDAVAEPPAGLGANVKGTLSTRGARVEKTQAFKQLQNAIEQQPANKQVDFVLSMLQQFNIKPAAKTKLRMRIRQELK